MNWQYLDMQMERWASYLIREVKLPDDAIKNLATTMAEEVRLLSANEKQRFAEVTPILVKDRLNELKAFQVFMESVNNMQSNPAITRAQVIVQNYICFVYLPESCFRIMAKVAPPSSAIRKCAKFLSDDPVRSFRNAIAHANWTYRDDFRGILYWAKKGSEPDAKLEQFEVDQESLNFWQTLSRCVAYISYSNL